MLNEKNDRKRQKQECNAALQMIIKEDPCNTFTPQVINDLKNQLEKGDIQIPEDDNDVMQYLVNREEICGEVLQSIQDPTLKEAATVRFAMALSVALFGQSGQYFSFLG